MKHILLIDAHPDDARFSSALLAAYKKGAEEAGFKLATLTIRDLRFEPNLKYGYAKRVELEPDLLAAMGRVESLRSHGLVPSRLVGWVTGTCKGFIDRTFLPSIHVSITTPKSSGAWGWDGYLEERLDGLSPRWIRHRFSIDCYIARRA